MTSRDKKNRTDTELRNFLERIFATNALFTFDEIIMEIKSCIHIDIAFLVYIREKSWFSVPRAQNQDNYLKFGFLSFEIRDGNLHRFSAQKELVKREEDLIKEGYRIKESGLCRILYNANDSDDLTRILNLLMRILVAFYKNCGSYDHFRDSVAARFTKDFFTKNPTGRLPDLIDYLEGLTDLSISLWQPRDEMYFRDESQFSAQAVLIPFPETTRDYPSFIEDKLFSKDLKTSILRRNQTFGKTSEGRPYVIKTFSSNHFTPSPATQWSGYEVRQKAVAIFEPKENQVLTLDGVYHANFAIKGFLDAVDELRVSDIVFNSDARCLRKETEIAERPLLSGLELEGALKDAVEKTFEDVAKISHAELITLWLHDPFSKKLLPTISVSYDKSDIGIAEEPLLLDELQHITCKSFINEEPISLSHPRWIESEKRQYQALKQARPVDNTDKDVNLDQAFENRKYYRNSGKTQECACLAIPVRRGGLAIGVIEVGSTSVGQLTFDAALFEKLAAICGDTIRKLELANDRAWLTRMSYIHTARHRIEELLREVETRAGDVGKELIGMIKQGQNNQGDLNGVGKSDEASVRKRMESLLQKFSTPEVAAAWMRCLEKIRSSSRFGIVTFTSISDVMETLAANASHSAFDIRNVEVTLKEASHTGRSYILITYMPVDVWLDETRMNRLGVSPIPSNTSLTYHYGLFLLGSQIRMLGGAMHAKDTVDDIGNSEFGLAFRIPII